MNSIGAKVEAGGGTILSRIIILKTSGHPNHGGFDIRCDRDELSLVVAITDQAIKSTDAGYGQSRRSTESGAGRCQAVSY